MSIVWQISAVSYPNETIQLNGIVLKRKPKLIDSKSGVFKNFLSILTSYFNTAEPNKTLLLTVNKTTKSITTDSNGYFNTSFLYENIEKISIKSKESNELIPIVQEYPLIFQKSKSSFYIISDIDDTIVKSYTADVTKRITTILFKRPSKRLAVEYTQRLFRELIKYNPAIYFVSKSESNLFYLLTSVIETTDLPKGTLFLTPYLKWHQLFRPKKGRDYKYIQIAKIISNSEEKKFILLGDDTQKDMEVYTSIIQNYPGRIIHVYIRQTQFRSSKKQLEKLHNLKSANVPVTYFTEKDEFTELPNIN